MDLHWTALILVILETGTLVHLRRGFRLANRYTLINLCNLDHH